MSRHRVYHVGVLGLILSVFLASAVEVERVLAVVNQTPILASDVELAELAQLTPREPGESEDAYRVAVLEGLIALELRWQDIEAAAIVPNVHADLDAAWQSVVKRAGGEDALHERLAAVGLSEAPLRDLVRRAAIVEAYVASRFAPFTRPTSEEVEAFYAQQVVPAAKKEGKPAPDLAAVRDQIESLLRERKLDEQVERWTADLAKRGVVVRYLRAHGSTPTPAPGTGLPTPP